MDVTLHLLDMGFTDEEVSSAIDNFGPEVPISELADSIFARRIAQNCVQEDKDLFEVKNNHGLQTEKEPRCLVSSTLEHQKNFFSTGNMGEEATSSSKDIIDDYREIVDRTDSKQSSVHGRVKERLKHSFSVAEMGKNRTSNLNIVNGSEEMHKRKKVEGTQAYEKTTSYDNKMKEAKAIASEEKIIATPVPYIEIEDFSSEPSCLKKPERNITSQGVQHLQSKPPFFLFGNVSDVSPETWRRLSHFLYGIEPEHVNTQFFSAIIRKEGYYHNLPRGDRFHILPKPPMTIEDALPHTGRWWPAWDTRKQLSCITHDTAGVAHMCDRLEKMLEDSRGILSTQQQLDALHQCKNLNLVWVGHHRLGPIEPDHIERILGYPVQHTKVQGLEPSERFAALKCCFQIDTLGYHLSVLKRMYPSGLRVLSVFSGIGGAEVALHRLGIHLKCVVSVDVPRVNGAILKRWWQNTGQSGELRQIDGIERLTGKKIESLVEEFGGFDLVIGANPCTCLSQGPSGRKSLRMEINPFHEFARVLKTLRSLMGRNN